MYLSEPHKHTVSEPTLFVDRDQWDDHTLQFGVLMPDGQVVRFEPEIRPTSEPSETFVGGILLTSTVLNLSAAELESVRRFYGQFAGAIQAYYELCVYTTCGPIAESDLATALTFDLTDAERLLIKEEHDSFTFIYLIRDRTTGFTKIGRSHTPYERLKQLQKQSTLLPTPNDFHLIFYARYYGHFEVALHKRYADKRVRGEWFDLTQEDIQNIRHEFEVYTGNPVIDCVQGK